MKYLDAPRQSGIVCYGAFSPLTVPKSVTIHFNVAQLINALGIPRRRREEVTSPFWKIAPFFTRPSQRRRSFVTGRERQPEEIAPINHSKRRSRIRGGRRQSSRKRREGEREREREGNTARVKYDPAGGERRNSFQFSNRRTTGICLHRVNHSRTLKHDGMETGRKGTSENSDFSLWSWKSQWNNCYV